jgi:hypothetical protein
MFYQVWLKEYNLKHVNKSPYITLQRFVLVSPHSTFFTTSLIIRVLYTINGWKRRIRTKHLYFP